ncbi:glycosyl transferase family 2 [Nitrosococcus halophilus Nc 4]|uniref:Glycosyl transferase family 2 n=1 Tax=Nitrosococcus halophilus (strain Nc4) TaxID=472759 RepID=D5C073_NITHN|nr:glycosyltransferase [Nitrosococcus halophilus]ADE14399.1 glycosyl transferase family 2 [Nitrosococcus halophilus Nc 4]
MSIQWVALPGLFLWWGILLLPWRPWSSRENLAAQAPSPDCDLSQITVLIPARNEAPVIGKTLRALQNQGKGLQVILVDDQSNDGTAKIAQAAMPSEQLQIIAGKPLPPGWSGKLWALEQGRHHIKTPLTLLLDGDIRLQPGMIEAIRNKMEAEGQHLVSLMAWLRMETFWEKLLMPAFVYFFKLLYPFHLSNKGPCWIAAAAGGCILIKTQVLAKMGGFGVLRGALIDDCALARQVKSLGYRTWIGLSHGVHSLRPYPNLTSIWEMIARTAFTQLGYSNGLLLLCSAIFIAAFWLPLIGLGATDPGVRWTALLALMGMILSYLPILRYYGLSTAWSLTLPLTAALYLAMTWSSAVRYWRGERSRWKARLYRA